MLKVAEEYGVSAVALPISCRKLSVPVPGRGHWAKLAHGHEGVKKPPLPKLDKVPVIYRSPVVQKKPTNSGHNDPEFSAISDLLSSGALNPPSLDPTARQHPLIRGTASRLRSQTRKDENRILLPREPGGLGVKVSPGSLDRALQVMAQVIAVVERQGLSMEISEEARTVVLINGEHVAFGIEEPIRREGKKKPRVPNPTNRWDYDEVVTHEPGGKLVLSIHADTSGPHEQRKRWSDAKIQKVESLIGDFVAGLMRTAVALRRKEEERKRHEAEEQKKARERAQLREDIQEEEKKLEQFNKGVDAGD